MTLFEGEQNGRYETDHLHIVLNEHIDFTEEGLSDDRKYSILCMSICNTINILRLYTALNSVKWQTCSVLKQEHFWKVRIKL